VIEITKPETEAFINQRLQTGAFKDAEAVILHALRSSSPEAVLSEERRQEAIERLKTFGKRHGLTLRRVR
jgi:hypothetical protein